MTQLSIRHETIYRYASPLSHTVKRLCLTPASFATQKTLRWSISAPGFETALSFRDCFGNMVHLATSYSAGETVSVVAEGLVETSDAAGIVQGLPASVPDIVFLRQTPATLPTAAMQEWCSRKVKPAGDTLQTLHRLMGELHAKVAYEIGATDQSTTAAQAFAAGRGVCQDHSHIFIGLARKLGIAARYVTGYLVTGEGASSTAAHAWAEALVPDLGWVGFDAANCKSPTDHYVRVACGIEANSISPIRGSRRGGGSSETMAVDVRVEIAQQ